MPRLLVIADDLSGATDVGVQFAKLGIAAFVVVRPETRPLAELFRDYEVVLANTESRHASPAEAWLRVNALVNEARGVGVDLFYKKTDSTLRGNVGAELNALLKASGKRTLCFVPAHPALGRTTRDGVQFVQGVRLARSVYGRDPRYPVLESRVPVLLQRQGDALITLVRRNELESFSANPPGGIVVSDAETADDIARAALAICQAGCLNVLAGPAALASCLPDLIPFQRATPKRARLSSPLLVVNGSLNEVTLRQFSHAERNGFAAMLMSPDALLAVNEDGDEARNAIAEAAATLVRRERCVLLGSVRHTAERNAFDAAAKQLGLDASGCPERIALSTGHVVANILARCAQGHGASRLNLTLGVIGGDTLAGVARANGWPGILPRGEVLPGVAVCVVPQQPGLVLITKPGGFGDDGTLVNLRHALADT